MDSVKRVDNSLSISSIVSDTSPNNDEPEITTKTSAMLKLILEAVSDTNAENSALRNEILELLNVLKFDIKYLPSDIKEGIHTTTAILRSEGLPAVDETALQLCLEKRKIYSKMKEREERLLKARYNAAFAKYNVLQEKLNPIRKGIEQIEDILQLKMSNAENLELQRTLWSNKLHDYKGEIEKLEQELDSINNDEIGLDKTLQKSSLLIHKLNELSQLNSSLERYDDLPPNLLQAKNMLEYKRRELEKIENLIHDKINN